MSTKEICPFKDFEGHPIREGDKIIHPSGEQGTVVILQQYENDGDRWRIDYEDGVLSRLCLQIGDKGRAIVIQQ